MSSSLDPVEQDVSVSYPLRLPSAVRKASSGSNPSPAVVSVSSGSPHRPAALDRLRVPRIGSAGTINDRSPLNLPSNRHFDSPGPSHDLSFEHSGDLTVSGTRNGNHSFVGASLNDSSYSLDQSFTDPKSASGVHFLQDERHLMKPIKKINQKSVRVCGCFPNTFTMWQVVTCLSLWSCWVGTYFARNSLFVMESGWEDSTGMGNAQSILGTLLTTGYVGYMLGKVFVIGLGDNSKLYTIGVSNLYMTLVLSSLPVAAMAMIPTRSWSWLWIQFPLYMTARFFQSVGWPGVVQIVSHWFLPEWHGRVMASLCTSWTLGDALTRGVLSMVISIRDSWRFVFIVAAVLTISLVLVLVCLVRNEPWPSALVFENDPSLKENWVSHAKEGSNRKRTVSVSEQFEPTIQHYSNNENTPENNSIQESEPQKSLKDSFLNLIHEPSYIYGMLLSVLATANRELFNSYLALFLKKKVSTSEAALISSLFPLSGMLSILVCGWWTDRFPKVHMKMAVIPVLNVLLCLTLFTLAVGNTSLDITLIVILVIVSGLTLLGPYSLYSGRLSLDISRATNESVGVICAMMDGIGNVGAIMIIGVSGFVDFRIMFGVAALSAALSAVLGLLLCWVYFKKAKQNRYDSL